MPESRKRHNHPFQKPSGIPSSQRTKGRIIWSILLAVFGLVIAFFASNNNSIAIGGGGLIGAILGYFIGRNMEQASRK